MADGPARVHALLAALALAGCGAAPGTPTAAGSPASAAASAPDAPSPGAAPAEPAAFDAAALERLNHADGPKKWNHVPSGRAERYGHAEVLVHAPLADVARVVTDFVHYREFAPTKFQASRIVGKAKGETDVYFQIPIMHGMVTLWNVTRFTPTREASPGVQIVEGRQVKGNLKDLHVAWTLRALGPEHTVLACDLLLVLNVAAPQDAVDEELRDAAGQAVDAVWTRAQGGARAIVPFAPR